jgi:hypothetical protein
MTVLGTLLADFVSAAPPDPVTRTGAQAAARDEVAKSAYHRHDPSALQRLLSWVVKKLLRWLQDGTSHAPGHATGAVLIIAIGALVAVLVIRRVGTLRRTPQADESIFGVEEISADDHRQRADRFAADGLWAESIRERLRAIARELEHRGVLDPRPGRTADELCGEAGLRLPVLAHELRDATSTFDEVWYGGRAATAADEAQLRALDKRLAGSHRSLVAAG